MQHTLTRSHISCRISSFRCRGATTAAGCSSAGVGWGGDGRAGYEPAHEPAAQPHSPCAWGTASHSGVAMLAAMQGSNLHLETAARPFCRSGRWRPGLGAWHGCALSLSLGAGAPACLLMVPAVCGLLPSSEFESRGRAAGALCQAPLQRLPDIQVRPSWALAWWPEGAVDWCLRATRATIFAFA